MTRALQRGLGFVALLALVMGASVQRARAVLAEQLLTFSQQLHPVPGQAADRTLELNGARLHVRTATISADVPTVLDRFEAACAESAPRLVAELHRPAPAAQDQRGTVEAYGRAARSVLRQDLDGAGVAVCLAQPDDAGLAELGKRAAVYLRTRDLSVFGGLRYLAVTRTSSGKAYALLVYNAGPLRLHDMFPARGDAAGADLAQVPRPRGGRRLLSTRQSDGQYELVAHALRGSSAHVLRAYLDQLARVGYREQPIAGQSTLTSVERAGLRFIIHATQDERDAIIAVAALALPTETLDHVD